MNFEELDVVIERLRKKIGVKNIEDVSVWLGKDPTFISYRKSNSKTTDAMVCAIVDKCIKEKIDVNYILTGKESASISENSNDEINRLQGEIRALERQLDKYCNNKHISNHEPGGASLTGTDR